MGGVKYFPTQLETYRQCPLKYQCSRDPEIKDKYRKATPNLYLGTCVHDALEAFFDISQVPVSDRTYERLSDLLRRAWAGVNLSAWKRGKRLEERTQVFGDDREMEAAWGKRALNMLYRYYLIMDRAAVPFTSEQFHEATLASGVVLGGKIDRVDRDEDGSLRILDYKTGKPPFKTDDESVAEEDIQLSAYAIVIRKKYRVRISRCSLVFVAHDQEVGFSPDDAFLATKAKVIEEIVREIESDTEFEPKKNHFCAWCEYKELCPIGKDIPSPEEKAEEDPDVPF